MLRSVLTTTSVNHNKHRPSDPCHTQFAVMIPRAPSQIGSRRRIGESYGCHLQWIRQTRARDRPESAQLQFSNPASVQEQVAKCARVGRLQFHRAEPGMSTPARREQRSPSRANREDEQSCTSHPCRPSAVAVGRKTLAATAAHQLISATDMRPQAPDLSARDSLPL